jgi:hypothetical protein
MASVTRVPWRRVGALLPAVALIGAGTALAATGGQPGTDIVAETKPLITVPQTPLQRLEAPVLPPLPALPAPPTEIPARLSSTPAALQSAGIPALALDAYRRAATLVSQADSECRIDWALVAAIGKIESDHGRFAGNGIDTDGTVRPGIYGIPLTGANNTARIADTDGGALDRDTAWDRAVGPMQFIPGTWRTVGVDANGDGAKDPQNVADAATATAVYLCSGPGNLTDPTDLGAAILRYNHSDAYVRQVIAIADGYRGGVTVLPSDGLSASQRGGSPYLPTGEQPTMASYDPVVASQPAPKPASKKPAKETTTASGSESTSGSGSSGDGSSGSDGGPGTPTGPQPTATRGVADTVNDVVDTVTEPLTGGTAPNPSPTPSPSPSTTSTRPLTLVPRNGTCPDGYELDLRGTLCLRL